MSLIKYRAHRFNKVAQQIIAESNNILRRYAVQGYDLTLRQLYYAFVSRDLFPPDWADKKTGSTNNERSYKRLGDIINDARLAGLVDWSSIIDRTRALRGLAHWNSPDEIVAACAHQFDVDHWASQDHYVEVWIEKDALAGIVAQACQPLDIPYLSCRGYTSQSQMHSAAIRLVAAAKGRQTHIIHLGDHDPSGMDMTRDIDDRLSMFMGYYGYSVDVTRIALNMDQVRQYEPPPNPAKITDSRAAEYIREFGESSWELDALEPKVLTELITDEIYKYRDMVAWQASQALVVAGRARLEDVAERMASGEI